MKSYDFLIVGAGLTGAVLAERLTSNSDRKVLIIDKRKHIGGNCYDYNKGRILVQKYGPHIFHTNYKDVWAYLSQFTEWADYKHKVIAFSKGKYYPMPINLQTVNLFYGINLKNKNQLRKFLEQKGTKIKYIKNSRDFVLSKFGKELYETFVKHYTKKQWGKYPHELDSSVLKRLPIRYNDNPYYFEDKYQGLPKKGFTKMIKNMLNNKNITVMLNTSFSKIRDKVKYKKLIFTGPMDQFFNYRLGKLEYRSTDFKFKILRQESFQPNSVVNYVDKEAEFPRITEFKKFYNINSDKTIICREKFTSRMERSYPVINRRNMKILSRYLNKAKKLKNVAFLGRLGQFKYMDMDEVVKNALDFYKKYKINGFK